MTASRKTFFPPTLTLLLALAAVGCNRKADAAGADPQPAADADKDEGYAADKAAELVAAAKRCSGICEPVRDLAALGQPAAGDLVAIALDGGASKDAREAALAALAKLEVGDADAERLFDVALAETDFDLFSPHDRLVGFVAERGVTPSMFDKARAEADKHRRQDDEPRLDPIFAKFPAETTEWATQELARLKAPGAKAKFEERKAYREDRNWYVARLEAATGPEALPMLEALHAMTKGGDGELLASLSALIVRAGGKDEIHRAFLFELIANEDAGITRSAAVALGVAAPGLSAEERTKAIAAIETAKQADGDELLGMRYDHAIEDLQNAGA